MAPLTIQQYLPAPPSSPTSATSRFYFIFFKTKEQAPPAGYNLDILGIFCYQLKEKCNMSNKRKALGTFWDKWKTGIRYEQWDLSVNPRQLTDQPR